MAGSKYATEEEWLAAKRASKKAYTERKKAGLVAPAPAGRAKPGPKPKYASVEEKQAAVKGYSLNYRIRNEARIEARKAPQSAPPPSRP